MGNGTGKGKGLEIKKRGREEGDEKGRDEGRREGAPIEMKAPNQNPKYASGRQRCCEETQSPCVSLLTGVYQSLSHHRYMIGVDRQH